VSRLAAHFVERYALRFNVGVRRISPEALAMLEAYPWPGNIRELEAVIKVAAALANDVVLPEHLPGWISGKAQARDRLSSPAVMTGPFEARRSDPPRADAVRGDAVRSDPPRTEPASEVRSERVAGPAGDVTRVRIELDVETDADNIDLKVIAAAAEEQAERAILEAVLRRGHSHARLAKILNLDPKTLRGKLRKHGLVGGAD
jgi:DNA-binding NtrC family response regulator